MTLAAALTFADPDRDLEPAPVFGEYATRFVESLSYTQHFVAGVPVDPATVVLAEVAANVFCPTGPGGGIDPTCSPGGVKAVVRRNGGSIVDDGGKVIGDGTDF